MISLLILQVVWNVSQRICCSFEKYGSHQKLNQIKAEFVCEGIYTISGNTQAIYSATEPAREAVF